MQFIMKCYKVAIYKIGTFYENGIVDQQDREKAIEYYHRSADLGCKDLSKKLTKIQNIEK